MKEEIAIRILEQQLKQAAERENALLEQFRYVSGQNVILTEQNARLSEHNTKLSEQLTLLTSQITELTQTIESLARSLIAKKQ
jgi:cell division protein FtsB